MLEEQLKYLEQKYFRNYRQHLREKSRIQSELHELEDIADEEMTQRIVMPNEKFRSSVEENNPQNYSYQQNLPAHNHQQKQLPEMQEGNGKLRIPNAQSRNRSRYSYNSPKILHARFPGSMKGRIDCNQKQEHSNQSNVVYLDNRSLNHRQMSSPISGNANDTSVCDQATQALRTDDVGKRSGMFTSDVWSSQRPKVSSNQVFCKYTPEPLSSYLCHNFPCVTPATYHTIGYRRNEMDPVSTVMSNSRGNQSKFETTLKESSEKNIYHGFVNNRLETSSITDRNTTNVFKNPSHKNCFMTSRLSSNSDSQRLPLRPVNGPPFSPMPADSILELVRSGPITPLVLSHTRARPSVKDKIRHLKQAVSEMRARNDRTKPHDWTVNYGAHLPPRMLMNPVLP